MASAPQAGTATGTATTAMSTRRTGAAPRAATDPATLTSAPQATDLATSGSSHDGPQEEPVPRFDLLIATMAHRGGEDEGPGVALKVGLLTYHDDSSTAAYLRSAMEACGDVVMRLGLHSPDRGLPIQGPDVLDAARGLDA